MRNPSIMSFIIWVPASSVPTSPSDTQRAEMGAVPKHEAVNQGYDSRRKRESACSLLHPSDKCQPQRLRACYNCEDYQHIIGKDARNMLKANRLGLSDTRRNHAVAWRGRADERRVSSLRGVIIQEARVQLRGWSCGIAMSRSTLACRRTL